jgi:hypothetical protein
MKIILILLLVFFSSVTNCFAQQSASKKLNSISCEVGKNGLIYNISYDHLFKEKNFGLRLLTGSNFGRYLNAKSIGGGGYYIYGKKNKYAEFGIDLQYLNITETSDDQKGFASILIYPNKPTDGLLTSLNLGFRKYNNRSLFRIGVSPSLIKSNFFVGGYLSFGFLFN